MKRYLFLSVCLLAAHLAPAQELNCTVNLNSDQLVAVQKTDFSYFSQLKTVISDLMNNRRWTNDQFGQNEKINCTLTVNLLRSETQGVFQGNAQLTVSRPVYGTNYQTIILSYVDRGFNFSWLPTQPIFYRENQFSDDLTQILAFYANIILAVDYDSFSRQGGNPYIQRAYQVVNLAQASSPNQSDWSNTDNGRRNRFWLVENLQSQQVIPFRDGFYNYHRLGLDAFASNPVQARKYTMDLLTNMRQITLQKPGAVLLNSFFDAKSDELLNIMAEGTRDERKRAFDLLSFLDPSKTENYRRLLN
ncbi:DUF4835 family protein [Fibrella sp. WM1]|uniref:type IX secretion system protein PorD n=1 Tax=Fibrella musci TaxID=3242485 RepID=UPI00351F8F28